MRIQKLEIQGFKSFADRTTIRFGTGITGVVGPNGCGKSNIVDALRWVMGEMSPRHLRGGSMQDVIFNGSDARGPMGMAEVTLTFENDGGGIPPEYANFSEIQVTRRLFRDGDSDYEINKTPCRLKDIHDLFAGSGLGKAAYSIVSQGQVAEIMRVKPEERRKIIEEAAGITKYKARKDAAVRKMDATRTNLQRISDVTTEIGKRLGSLRRQAKKAERYRELKHEAREIELHVASMRYLELTNAIAFDRDQYETLTADVAGDVDRVQQMEADIEARRSALMVKERALADKQARLYELDNGLALNEQAAEHAREQFERSKKRDEDAAVELEMLREQRALLEASLEELKAGNVQLELELNTDAGVLDAAIAELEAEKKTRAAEGAVLEDLRRKVIARSTEAAKHASDVVNIKASVEDMERRKTHIVDEREPLVAEQARALEEETRLSAEKAALDADRESTEAARVENTSKMQETRARFDVAQRGLHAAKDSLQQRRNRLHSLEEIHARYEQSPEAVRDLLMRGGALEGRGRLLVDLFDAPSDIESALEAALGSRLQAVVVPDADAVTAAVAQLEERKNGRVELLVEDNSPAPSTGTLEGAIRVLDVVTKKKDSAAVDALLSSVFIVPDLVTALLQWPDARAQGLTLATRTGEVLLTDGSLKGGSGGDQGVLRQKREMRELTEEVKALEAAAQEAQRAVEDIDVELKALDEQMVEIVARQQSISLRFVEVRGALKRVQDDGQRAAQRLDKLTQDEARIQEQLGRAQGELEARQVSLAGAEAARAEHEADLAARGGALVEMDQHIAEKQDEVTGMKVRAASIAERREMLKKNLEGTERQASDLESRLGHLQKQIEDGHGERAALTTKEADARGAMETLGRERVDIKATLDEERQQAEKEGDDLRALEHETRTARTSLDEARSAYSGLQVRIRERELELDAIVDRTIERHRITPGEALFDYHMREIPPPESEDRLEEIERAIETLGAINLTAIDECAELEHRHEFLRTQADDLTHALNQLEKAIVKINRTTRKRFQETFEGINERFQQVFPRLFRGGKAWLALTDPNDLLTTGVEIYAQPPGKKLGSVVLMSGGEQALTAVSLLFAIFLLKPSPFCLLDEVDAPLDEANVGRFNDMVKDVSAISQFIVITHNKRTMEVADQLYGVTMEEPGISKTVNVRIQ